MQHQRITTESFDGLAFTVVTVRYAGPTNARGSRWIATITRGEDKTRVTIPYSYEIGSGARNAARAAHECFAKARESIDEPTDPAEWVAIPGELDRDSYAFTFIPAEYLNS